MVLANFALISTMNKINLTVVIPVFNEQNSLSELQSKLTDSLKIYELTCIYVDDASTDNSFNRLVKLKKENKKDKITIVRLKKHFGKSAALAVGFKYSNSELVATIDADLQDDPYEIPNLIKKLNEGYDLVSGWRYVRNDNLGKKIPSKFFNTLIRLLSGIEIHDFNTGLKVFKLKVVKKIYLTGNLHRYIPVLAVSYGFKVAEIPVKHYKRKFGKSKYGVGRIFNAGFDFLITWPRILLKHFPERVDSYPIDQILK